MEEGKELVNKFLKYIGKSKSLTEVCKELEISAFEAMGLVHLAKEQGVNIVVQKLDNDIQMINQGDIEFVDSHTYTFDTDDNNEFKFIAISDLRLGSKSQQLSILNDIYEKGHKLGYNNVILCGNISAGIYPITDIYAETNFIDDSQGQIEYIADMYPRVDGMRTYLITGKEDGKHLKLNKINIGKRLQEIRDDMIYLGGNSCDVRIDKAKMKVLGTKLGKTYTSSYRTQQQIDSFRSEDKPDILLYGGLMQMEKYFYRNVQCITVPSVCATTKEMSDKRYANTIGAWYVTVKTNKKGELESFRAFNSPYYVTEKNDYKQAKPLRIEEQKSTEKKLTKKRTPEKGVE